MLTIQSMSGYDIRKVVDESIAHFWNESYGQIYPILKGLGKDGLIAPTQSGNGKRNRQAYEITAKGRAALEAWLLMPPGRDLVRNELLLKLFFAANGLRAGALRHIREYREAQAAELQRFRVMEQDLIKEHGRNRNIPYWLITLRFGIRNCEAAIRWAEDSLRELKHPDHRQRKAAVL